MLSKIEVTGKKDTRSGFGDGIVEAARNNENIVALTADLAGSLKLGAFMKEFPERYFQVGIAASNIGRYWHDENVARHDGDCTCRLQSNKSGYQSHCQL